MAVYIVVSEMNEIKMVCGKMEAEFVFDSYLPGAPRRGM